MYQQKLVTAVKVDGKVLREENENVYIPFGSDFALVIKNLNSVKALVKIWIDGTCATEGTSGLVIGPNQTVDLERFIKNGNLSAGNKFKFIERTAQISENRGNKVDNGLVRIEFEYEAPLQPFMPINGYLPGQYPWYRVPREVQTLYNSTGAASADLTTSTITTNGVGTTFVGVTSNNLSAAGIGQNSTATTTTLGVLRGANSEVGITVPGAVSNQQFSYGYFGKSDGVKHSMVLRLLGEVQGNTVVAPVTVKQKKVCSTCGKKNKASSSFCSVCGTGLHLI